MANETFEYNSFSYDPTIYYNIDIKVILCIPQSEVFYPWSHANSPLYVNLEMC